MAFLFAGGLVVYECQGYQECFDEGFVSLFDGQTFRNWEGDPTAFLGEERPYVGGPDEDIMHPYHSDGYALCYWPTADGRSHTIMTRKSYENFVLRFCYLVTSGAQSGIGLGIRPNGAPEGVEVAIADDFGLEGGQVPVDRFSGSLVGLCPSRRERNVRLDWKHETGNTYAKPVEKWNMVEIRAVDGRVTVMLNGEFVAAASPGRDRLKGRIALFGRDRPVKWLNLRIRRVGSGWKPEDDCLLGKAPEGFVSLFDCKSLTGWKGVTPEDGFDIPWVRQAADESVQVKMQSKADSLMEKFWHVRDGALYFDGKKGGYSLATAKDYGDFEFYADWRILSVTGDSGFFPRGMCQVQIWDAHNMWHIGSGGLYNNVTNECHAMTIADKVAGDWNRCYIRMVGDLVTVRLNGVTVVDEVPLENAYAGKWPGPIPRTGRMELQCHGDPVEFRNIYVRELR